MFNIKFFIIYMKIYYDENLTLKQLNNSPHSFFREQLSYIETLSLIGIFITLSRNQYNWLKIVNMYQSILFLYEKQQISIVVSCFVIFTRLIYYINYLSYTFLERVERWMILNRSVQHQISLSLFFFLSRYIYTRRNGVTLVDAQRDKNKLRNISPSPSAKGKFVVIIITLNFNVTGANRYSRAYSLKRNIGRGYVQRRKHGKKSRRPREKRRFRIIQRNRDTGY